jgi:peptide chain release factor 1
VLDRLPVFEARLEVLDRVLMDPATAGNARRMAEVARDHAHVSGIVNALRAHQRLLTDRAGAVEMLSEDDAEVRAMARAEVTALDEQLAASERQIRLQMLPPDPYVGRPIVLEIRAGTGGDEAALFAADLFRMYSRFIERRGLRLEVVDLSEIRAGGSTLGFKEAVALVHGAEAYTALRFEGGVHRVQRVPATEAQGRIHTSAATVAVLPEPDDVDVRIDAKDLRIDVMRAGGPGGQSVNTTDSAVRIVHIPTGLMVLCQDEKSQHKNKDKAMRILKARLFEQQQAERDAAEAAARRAMVGTGDRSERIRTYNFPQNRLTDHRINLTLHSLDRVIEGDLEAVVGPLVTQHQAEALKAERA